MNRTELPPYLESPKTVISELGIDVMKMSYVILVLLRKYMNTLILTKFFITNILHSMNPSSNFLPTLRRSEDTTPSLLYSSLVFTVSYHPTFPSLRRTVTPVSNHTG